jgi:hypothetical protein
MICTLCAGTGYLHDARPSRPCPSCAGVGTHARIVEDYGGHIDSPSCWCGPVQDKDEPAVWVHRDVPRC